MNTTTVTWPGSSVVQPAIKRPTAMRLAQTEYQRVIDAVDALPTRGLNPGHRLHCRGRYAFDLSHPVLHR